MTTLADALEFAGREAGHSFPCYRCGRSTFGYQPAFEFGVRLKFCNYCFAPARSERVQEFYRRLGAMMTQAPTEGRKWKE